MPRPRHVIPPPRRILVTADAAEIERFDEADDLTIIEPAVIGCPDTLELLLFDPATRTRRADVLILGPSARAGDRRSMMPPGVWEGPAIAPVLLRFTAAGGRIET